MHTLARVRGHGVGTAMVEHITNYAREIGIKQLSLETGNKEAYKEARSLYEKLGFTYCEAFGDYVLSEYNICMTKYLS